MKLISNFSIGNYSTMKTSIFKQSLKKSFNFVDISKTR